MRRDLGYVGGQNIRFEFRSDEGQMSRLPELAAVLVALIGGDFEVIGQSFNFEARAFDAPPLADVLALSSARGMDVASGGNREGRAG